MNSRNIVDKNILDVQVDRSNFAVTLEESRKQKEFTDVQLQVGDQLFDAHRVVLAANSPVLKAALTDQWSSSKICPISDQYVDPSIVEPLLHFLYMGSIQLTPDNVHPVCVAAHFLQIPTLLEPSVKHLCRLITVENVISVFEFSVNCDLKPLRYPCLRFIAKHHDRIFRNSRIYNFSSRMFNELILGLKEHTRPWTTLKQRTFETIAYWTERNLSERSNELPGLLKNLPLEDLPFYFLSKTVSRHRLVKDSISCIQIVSEAFEKIRKQTIDQPKRCKNLMVFGPKGESITCCDTRTKAWRTLPTMLEPRDCFGVTLINRKDIVVCGGASYPAGYHGYKQLDTVEMFEWSSQTWKQLPRMPFSSTFCSVVCLDGQLYVIGKPSVAFVGNTIQTVDQSNEVVCYSFETQQWRYIKPMNIARYEAKLIEYDNYLYVFGGGTKVVEKYDPLFDEWTCIEVNPEARNLGETDVRKVEVKHNKINVYGDHSLTMFDPETDAWSSYFGPGAKGSFVLLNGRVLVAKKDTNWIYRFSYKTEKWTKFLELDSQDCQLLAGPFY